VIAFIARWLRIRVLRAEIRDIQRELQKAKDAIARSSFRLQERARELEELGAKP
jgi:phage shock protein A